MSFIFVNKDHVKQTRQHLRSAHGVWKKIGAELRQEADKAMAKGPWSVTCYPSRAASRDPHDYYYEAPYWWPNPKNPAGPYIRRDGYERPDRHMNHWLAFRKLSNTVLILCYAGYYLENKAYLNRAVKLLKVWFLDPKTRMNPHMKYAEAIPRKCSGNRTGIIALCQLDRIVHALCFLQEYPDWRKELKGMTNWISTMLSWILTSKMGKEETRSDNNHAAWCVTHIATYAAFLQKPNVLHRAFEIYKKEIITKQIAQSGALPPELKRTKAFSYSLLNLDAQTLLCELAFQQGVNLWGYKTADGRGIETAIRFLLPYLNKPSSWKYQQIDGAIPDDQISLQYAALRLNIPECLRINQKRRGKNKLIRDVSPLGPLALLPGFPTGG